jgi:hypothetical protein
MTELLLIAIGAAVGTILLHRVIYGLFGVWP